MWKYARYRSLLKAIAQFGGGEYFHISGDGGVKVVTTPYDDKLYELNKE